MTQEYGPTQLDLPPLGLGTWSFAGGEYWGRQDVVDSVATVHAALEAGITLFDTAENYTGDQHSEEVLGLALEGRRDEAIIATKVAKPNLRPDDVVAACEASLVRLRTDRIDLYQIHWPNHDVPLAETVGAMDQLVTAGKIRAFGVCNFGPLDLTDLLALTRPSSNQMAYNLLWRGLEEEVAPLMEANDVGMMCYSPLAQGLLTGRYSSPNDVGLGVASSRVFSSTRETAGHEDEGFEDEAFAVVSDLIRHAAELRTTPPALAVDWLLARPVVGTVLVGARAPAEIAAIAASRTGDAVPTDILEELSRVSEPLKARLGGNLDMWNSESRMR